MTFTKKMLAPLAAVSLLALAGCGTGGAPGVAGSQSPATDQPSTATSETGHEGHDHGGGPEATETAEPSPRIVVGTETGVVVLDEHLEVIGSFPTQARPTLTTAHDGRHILAVQGAAGVVNIIDGGSWSQGHGDHFHSFTTEPTIFDEALEGGRPVHVVPNTEAGSTAVFFDEDGRAPLVTTEALEHAELHGLTEIKTDAGHHGVVAPLADGAFLVTQPGDEGAMPDTIQLRDAAGEVRQTYTCNDMHGDVIVGNAAAFGCVDSILVIRDGAGVNLPNPDTSGERVGGLVANADASTFLGDWAADSLVFVTGEQTTVVPVGVEYGNRAVTPDGRFVLLGTDGMLRVYDASGAELQTIEVTASWTKPTGHGGVAPSIATGLLQAANMVWVSEPDANKVHAIDLFSNTVTSVEVPGQPGSLAVGNAS